MRRMGRLPSATTKRGVVLLSTQSLAGAGRQTVPGRGWRLSLGLLGHAGSIEGRDVPERADRTLRDGQRQQGTGTLAKP